MNTTFPCTTEWRRAFTALLFSMVFSSPVSAQNTLQECHASAHSCRRSCQNMAPLGVRAVQLCDAGCSSRRSSCTAAAVAATQTPAQAPPARSSAPAPYKPSAESTEEAPSASTASSYLAPAELAYEGPVRFFPPFATIEKAEDKSAPFSGASEESLARGVLNTGFDMPQRNRSPAERALRVELLKEYAVLDQAGYASLKCSYGPFAGGGYSQVPFWHRKRAVLSPQMLELVKKTNAMDAAVAECPRTWGEALAIGTGQQQAASVAEIDGRTAAVQKRTGMRHIPVVAGAGGFEDERLLFAGVELNAIDMFDDAAKDPERSLESWRRGQPGLVRDTVLALHEAGQKILFCRYAHEGMWAGDLADASSVSISAYRQTPSAILTGIKFWSGKQPTFVTVDFLKAIGNMGLRGQEQDNVMVDLPLDACPGTYGQAMALIDGSPEALARANKAAALISGVDAKVRNAEAEDAAFKATVLGMVDGLEQNAGAMTPAAYQRAVAELKVPFNRLAGSVLSRLQDIPVGAAGRKRFDDWDRQWGAAVITSIHRMQNLGLKRAFRIETEGASMRDVFAQRGQGEKEKLAWINAVRTQLFLRPAYQAFTTAYEERLAGQPLTDPKFMERARSGLGLAARRADATAAPSRPASLTASNKTTLIFGTPGEIAAARFGAQVGDALGTAIGSAAAIRNQHAQLSSRIAESRRAFWECHARQCGKASELYLAYSVALRDKDSHYLLLPVYYQKIDRAMASGGGNNQPALVTSLLTYLGSGSVDNGIVMGCEAEADSVKSAFQESLGSDLDLPRMSSAFQKATETETYRSWQRCRDSKEFIYRPR